MAKALGSTGATFLGMIKHVEAARPRVVIAENVDDFKEGSANAEFFWSAFQQIGYFNMKYNKQIHHSIVQCFTFQFSNFKFQKTVSNQLCRCRYVGHSTVFKSSDYGSPQHRVRRYFVLVDLVAFDLDEEAAVKLAASMLEAATWCKCPVFPLSRFMLDNDDEYVTAEFARRRDAATGDSTKNTKWHATHDAFLAGRGLSRTRLVPTNDISSSEWFVLLRSREKECLAFAVTQSPNATSIDVNPRIDRLCIGKEFCLPTLTTNCAHWMRQQDGQKLGKGFKKINFDNRFMLGKEMLSVQGFPTKWLQNATFSDRLLADLAGNAMTMQVIMAVTLGILLKVPALSEACSEVVSDMEEAISAAKGFSTSDVE